MSNNMASRALSDLPRLSEFIRDPATSGFPEDFCELFASPRPRLLRATFESKDVVVVFRNEDLRTMAADAGLGMAVEHDYMKRFYRSLVFSTNPPIHKPMRQAVVRPLSPVNVTALQKVAKRLASDVLEQVLRERQIEFQAQFAQAFSLRFWATLFEMTHDEMEHLANALSALAPAFLFGKTREEIAATERAMGRYLDVISTAIDRALNGRGNEFIKSFAAGFHEIEVRPSGIGEMIAANVFDGLHTVAVAGTNALYQLLVSRDALHAVRTNQTLLSNALAEGLRLWAPLIYTGRCVLSDLEFAETTLPTGTPIMMLWAAGNRDPTAFEQPNRFDLWRTQRSERTFGGGSHICAGRYLVRMLCLTMLETVLAPDISIELTDARPTWLPRSGLRQLDSLHLSVRRVPR